jgi:hypothetical protein
MTETYFREATLFVIPDSDPVVIPDADPGSVSDVTAKTSSRTPIRDQCRNQL